MGRAQAQARRRESLARRPHRRPGDVIQAASPDKEGICGLAVKISPGSEPGGQSNSLPSSAAEEAHLPSTGLEQLGPSWIACGRQCMSLINAPTDSTTSLKLSFKRKRRIGIAR